MSENMEVPDSSTLTFKVSIFPPVEMDDADLNPMLRRAKNVLVDSILESFREKGIEVSVDQVVEVAQVYRPNLD